MTPNAFNSVDIHDTELGDVVAESNASAITRYLQKSMQDLLLDNVEFDPFAIAITSNRYMTASLNYEDRVQASRVAGRYFGNLALEAGEELLYVGTAFVGLTNDSGSDVRPADDPDARQVLVTHVQDLRPMHEASDVDGFVEALKQSDMRVSIASLHEGLIIDVLSDADKVIPHDQYNAISEDDRTGFTTLDSALLPEIFTGAAPSFAVIAKEADKAQAKAAV
ncbi:hypothetical protein [Synechococcus sp. BIOS-E4-1]|uniref:hypothetical protein n=1 Tax=Synechococcus sp. BIOS-E4-1 TaxID=1400864 RepID=UPI00164752E8|nr:hypothetical protein [Synechococcus sp. BIOS-E4-1]